MAKNKQHVVQLRIIPREKIQKVWIMDAAGLMHLDNRPTITVFSGSREGNEPVFKATAYKVGKLIAEQKWRVVYGGGPGGTMGAVADGAADAGGEVIGVTPEYFLNTASKNPNEGLHPRATASITVKYFSERKIVMDILGDAFLALPGGYGTDDETNEAVTLRQTGIHEKPTYLMNIPCMEDGKQIGFYDYRMKDLALRNKTGFISDRHLKYAKLVGTPEEFIKAVSRDLGLNKA
ncbi:MAG: TIGR00730 family Rossman fold protein [Alphaproteobacteria bacterium]|nr:TIGR00730 family Rossman fold protein [Alphaproteobacteria bacterium]